MPKVRVPSPLARTELLASTAVGSGGLVDSPASALALLVRAGSEGPDLEPGAVAVAGELGVGDLRAELSRQSFHGAVGDIAEIALTAREPHEVLYVVGAGDGSAPAFRRAGAVLGRRAGGRTSLVVSTAAADQALRALVEGLLAGTYRPPRIESGTSPSRLGDLTLLPQSPVDAARDVVRRGVVTARALALARDLINLPADVAGPVELADEAVRVGRDSGLEVRVRDEAALRAEGFAGLLAVGAGSRRPPRLVELAYEPESAGRRVPHLVLVGKGIAFDSGGLSLKPREAMVSMKTDMAGAGVVLAVMSVLRELGVRARVTGLLPLAENLPDGAAYRPGDVITHYDGTTAEVLNTDAEGRLVLADALGYAVSQLAPDALVDIATLTGAASLGLGRRHGALFATDERLAEGLLGAADRAGERLWRMPLVEDYREALQSPVADIAHVPHAGSTGAGAITAALFLREFVGRTAWAHLDVAGPARADADEFDISKGGTGFGTRTLLRWLEAAR